MKKRLPGIEVGMLVWIEWEDATSASGWRHVVLEELPLIRCESVGWVQEIQPDYLQLCRDRSYHGATGELIDVAELISVPAMNVLSWCEIR